MTFHTNLNVPDDFRRFAVIGAKGMAEGDFVRNYFRVTDARSSEKLIDKLYVHSEASDHYGADEQMAADVLAHMIDGRPLPVSVVDALEAGLARHQDRRGAARPPGGRHGRRPGSASTQRSPAERPRRSRAMSRSHSATLFAFALLLPALLYILAIVAYPLVDTVSLSFTDAALKPVTKWVGWAELRQDLQCQLLDHHRPHLHLDLLLRRP